MNDTKPPEEIATVALPPRFTNPFQGLKGDPTAATVNCLMPKEAFIRVKQCRLEGGTIQTTMNLLWIKLINLLEKKGIQSYADVREFESAVQRSVLVLPEDLTAGGGGRPPAEPNSTVGVRDEPGAVEPVRSPVEGQSEQSDIPSDSAKGSTTRNKRGTKREKDKPKS